MKDQIVIKNSAEKNSENCEISTKYFFFCREDQKFIETERIAEISRLRRVNSFFLVRQLAKELAEKRQS